MTHTATHLHRLVLSLAVGAAVAVFAVPGSAFAASAKSFQISPPTANYPANPGELVHGTIKLTNLTDEPISLQLSKENFVAKGEEGEVELTDNANPLYSLAPWFNFAAPSIDIPARGTKEVRYDVAIPRNAEPGGRYGSILFRSLAPKLPSGQSGAAVEQRIAALIFARINGTANEKLDVLSFTTEKSFYEYGPVEFVTRLKNVGNVHEKPVGTITIKNMLGFKVATIPLDEHYVIPEAIRKLKNPWPGAKQPFLFGRYTAKLDAKYGASNQTLSATTSFIVLPWKLLAMILGGLLIVCLLFWKGRKRFRRAFRILAGRE